MAMVDVARIVRRIYVSPERVIYGKIIDHAEKCRETVEAFKAAIERHKRGEDYLGEIERVMRLEEEADVIRREILEKLSVSGLPPAMREDYIRLAERIDMIADWVKAAARILKAGYKLEIPDNLMPLVEGLADTSLRAVEKLKEALATALKDYRAAMRIIEEIEEMEDRGDDLYAEALSAVKGLNDVLVLKLIDSVENSIDACEDASDVLEEIIIRVLK